MTITIQPAPDYLLHFTATPAHGGLVHLKIESQWWGARDRDGLQTKFQTTLKPQEIRQLSLEIDKVAKP
jgi:hypothetical protein